jgi:hypothetical protein
MATKGAPATGVTISIGTPGTGETFVAIGQLQSVTWTQPTLQLQDVTNLSSPTLGQATLNEYLPTNIEPGTLSGTVIYLPGDAGQVAANAAFLSGVVHDFKIQFPALAEFSQTTAGDLYAFSGFLKTQLLPDGLDPKKVMTAKFEIQLTTAVTRTAGS